jgi:hypothetical protein
MWRLVVEDVWVGEGNRWRKKFGGGNFEGFMKLKEF